MARNCGAQRGAAVSRTTSYHFDSVEREPRGVGGHRRRASQHRIERLVHTLRTTPLLLVSRGTPGTRAERPHVARRAVVASLGRVRWLSTQRSRPGSRSASPQCATASQAPRGRQVAIRRRGDTGRRLQDRRGGLKSTLPMPAGCATSVRIASRTPLKSSRRTCLPICACT